MQFNLLWWSKKPVSRESRRRSRKSFGESLESREMLTTTSYHGLDSTQIQDETDYVIEGTALGEDRLERCSPSSDSASQFHYRLPAPFAADVDLDGRFTTEDIVATYQGQSTADSNSELLRLLSFSESPKFIGYEDDDTFVTFGECHVERLVENFANAEVSTRTISDAESGSVDSEITRLRIPGQFQIRAVNSFDAMRRLHTTTVDYHLSNDGVIYSRSQTTFNINTEEPDKHITWIFDRQGNTRRTTFTQVHPDREYQVTEVREFDDQQTIVNRRMIYSGSDGRVDIRIDFESPSSVNQKVVIRILTPDGESASTFAHAINTALPDDPIGDSNEVFLTQIRDGLGAAIDSVGDEFGEILRMNRPSGFGQIEHTLLSAGVTDVEAERYRDLIRYFDISLDLASAHLSDDWSAIAHSAGDVIDIESGTWKSSFLQFMEAEHLAVPLPPLVFMLSRNAVTERADQLVNTYRERLDSQLTTQYRQVTMNPVGHVDSILESMRRVKAQIRLLEFNQDGVKPTFDWIWARDRPETEALGLTNIVPLTGWYFYEELEDGSYARDDVNESLLRERIAHMLTNEDAFHVINIEHWRIDGEPADSTENLAKLKRTLDLIHDVNPNLMIGLYRLLPLRNLRVDSQSPDPAFDAWQAKNDFNMSALGPSVDLLFPSLYTLHLGDTNSTTEELWAKFAEENIREARRLAEGKPVIAFLAFYYHPNGNFNPKGWQWLEPELLTYQLLKLDGIADGVTLYNDISTDWSSLVDDGIGQVPALFDVAKQTNLVDAALSLYENWLSDNRDALVEKLQIEIQLTDTDGDDTLTAYEIDSLREQLSDLPTIWPRLQEFITDGE